MHSCNINNNAIQPGCQAAVPSRWEVVSFPKVTPIIPSLGELLLHMLLHFASPWTAWLRFPPHYCSLRASFPLANRGWVCVPAKMFPFLPPCSFDSQRLRLASLTRQALKPELGTVSTSAGREPGRVNRERGVLPNRIGERKPGQPVCGIPSSC